jgi:glycine betaine/proline transport system substrate-binding protein
MLRVTHRVPPGQHREVVVPEKEPPCPLSRAVAAPVLVVVAAVLSGCSPGPGSGITVQAAQFPWSAAKLTNAILAEVVAAHPELGVSTITTIQVGPATAWAGAQRGDVDLLSEVAMPNQEELAAKAADRIHLVHETYGNAQQGGSYSARWS